MKFFRVRSILLIYLLCGCNEWTSYKRSLENHHSMFSSLKGVHVTWYICQINKLQITNHNYQSVCSDVTLAILIAIAKNSAKWSIIQLSVLNVIWNKHWVHISIMKFAVTSCASDTKNMFFSHMKYIVNLLCCFKIQNWKKSYSLVFLCNRYVIWHILYPCEKAELFRWNVGKSSVAELHKFHNEIPMQNTRHR